MYVLKLKHHFSAAHKLENAYSSECNDNIHGHNWKVLIKIEAGKLVDGMIIDFKKLKEIVNQLDHKNLNDTLEFETTAENLSKYLQEKIKEEVFKRGFKSDEFNVAVTIWEADNASITYY